jgi:DNA-binding transcriptional MerR regulator
MKQAPGMSIGELAEETGVTPRTIRYYVAEGLLAPPGGAGQQRVYGYEHTVRLKLIRRLQAEHLPLKEIRARLERLSLGEIERLLEQAPRPRKRVDPRRLLAAVLQPAAAFGPPGSPLLLREMVPSPADASEPPPPEGLWRRVLLAPGVELHYQSGGGPEREARIQQVIAEVTQALADADMTAGEQTERT